MFSKKPQEARIVGSAQGWQIVVTLTGEIIASNSDSDDRIHLPPISAFPDVEKWTDHEGDHYRIGNHEGCPPLSPSEIRDCYIKKIILSCSPGNGAVNMAFAITRYGKQLAYCKRGDTNWKYVPMSFVPAWHRSTENVVYYNGLLVAFAYSFYGVEIFLCDFRGVNPTTKLILAHVSNPYWNV